MIKFSKLQVKKVDRSQKKFQNGKLLLIIAERNPGLVTETLWWPTKGKIRSRVIEQLVFL